jgi:hypothetical protein
MTRSATAMTASGEQQKQPRNPIAQAPAPPQANHEVPQCVHLFSGLGGESE